MKKIVLWSLLGLFMFGAAIQITGDFAPLILALILAYFGYRKFSSKKKMSNKISKGSVALFLLSGFFLLTFVAVMSAPNEPNQMAKNEPTSSAAVKDNNTVPSATLNEIQEVAATTADVNDKSEEETDTGKKTDRITVNFIEVTDGDTFKVLLDGKEEKVRLLLVDTPESVKQGTPVQPFAKEASNFTLAQLKKGNLTLELDVSERDKYGRLLAYAWVGDKMLNELLLEKGYARVAYIYPPNVKHVDQFKMIQVKAQESGLGIWSIENYAQEDGFDVAAANKSTAERQETITKKTESRSSSSTTKSTTSTPKRETVPKPDPKPSSEVYYKNCTAVRAAGADPIYEGEPGYSRKLDRDGDGVGCER